MGTKKGFPAGEAGRVLADCFEREGPEEAVRGGAVGTHSIFSHNQRRKQIHTLSRMAQGAVSDYELPP